ncbi:putative ACT domain, aminotransferase, class I/classII, pyridoxal phosphate-dependent transferase [Plasmopara halstedii]
MIAELKIAYEEKRLNGLSTISSVLCPRRRFKDVHNACAAVKEEEHICQLCLLLNYNLHIIGEYDQQEILTPEQKTNSSSYTRFLLLSKKLNLAWDIKLTGVVFKTSFVFGFKNSTNNGMLSRVLAVFSQQDVDLIKIESRPWNHQASISHEYPEMRTNKYQYLFIADVLGHLTDAKVSAAIRRLNELCAFVRILGSYAILWSGEVITEKSCRKVTVAKTVLIHGQTKQMEAEGKKVWSLCAMIEGNIKYAHMRGLVKLRSLISTYLKQAKELNYDPATEILVSNGAQQSIYQALYTICRPGQKVIIPTPYWLNYPEIVKLVYAEPVVLRTTLEENYLINPVELEKTLTLHPDAKVIILCNPSNPSGTLHGPEHLEQIAAVLRKPQFRHIVVISDEIYEQLLYQDEGVPERKHVSLPRYKAHAMTGLRVGYLAGPSHYIDPCTLLQAQLTSCPNTIGQVAAVEALKIWTSSAVISSSGWQICPTCALLIQLQHFMSSWIYRRTLRQEGVHCRQKRDSYER